MGFTGKDAAKFKVEYIERFNAMENFIEHRSEAKIGYKELIETLEDNGAGHWDKPNEADMLNIIVLGMKAKAYKESHGISDDETRAYLSSKQVYCLRKLQDMDKALIEMAKTFYERKAELQKYYDTKVLPKAALLFP